MKKLLIAGLIIAMFSISACANQNEHHEVVSEKDNHKKQNSNYFSDSNIKNLKKLYLAIACKYHVKIAKFVRIEAKKNVILGVYLESYDNDEELINFLNYTSGCFEIGQYDILINYYLYNKGRSNSDEVYYPLSIVQNRCIQVGDTQNDTVYKLGPHTLDINHFKRKNLNQQIIECLDDLKKQVSVSYKLYPVDETYVYKKNEHNSNNHDSDNHDDVNHNGTNHTNGSQTGDGKYEFTYDDDNLNVNDYSDPYDFYSDYDEYFIDENEAEDYYNEKH